MLATYTFFTSLVGIVILLSLKVWEIKRGAKPFSVLRYRLDMAVHKVGEKVNFYVRFVNARTLRLTLAYLVAKLGQVASMLVGKIRSSEVFRSIKGKVIPESGKGAVSEFLKDVAEFKKEANEEKIENSNKDNIT